MPKILLVSRGLDDLARHIRWAEHVRRLLGSDYSWEFLCGAAKPGGAIDPRVHWIGDPPVDLSDDRMIRHCQASDPWNLWKADLRYLRRRRSWRDMARLQAWTELKVADLFDRDDRPDAVFCTGGGNLTRSVAFRMAQAQRIPAWRIFDVSWTCLGRDHHRYWFVDNDVPCIGTAEECDFDHFEQDIHSYALDWITALRRERFDLSAGARTVGRRLWISGGSDVARDIGRVALRRPGRREAFDRLTFTWRRAFVRGEVDRTAVPDPYVVLPLNVAEDSSIALRAPMWSNPVTLVDVVARMLPYPYHLLVKPHPAHPAVLSSREMRDLKRRHPQLWFVSGDARMPDVLTQAKAMIVVASTSVVDAAVAGVPVLHMAEEWYTHRVGKRVRPWDIAEALEDIEENTIPPSEQEADLFAALKDLLRQSWPSPSADATDPDKLIAEGVAECLREL